MTISTAHALISHALRTSRPRAIETWFRLTPRLFVKAAETLLLATAFVAFAAALYPDARSGLRSILLKDYRHVLSTVTADLAGDGSPHIIAKVKTRGGLSLEIYETLPSGTTKLIETIAMDDKKDGYFDFNGQAANLAVDDVDHDGRLEILAPSFDHNLVGHLNIYTYDKSARSFQKLVAGL